MFERRYRDPVHNIITLDESTHDAKLIATLIDSKEFQRLRRIKQLGLALYAYQGAEHSRFTHSLGVMHIMTKVLTRLSQEVQIKPEDFTAARVGALLHDLGHGPFSHVIEKVLGFNHESWTVKILQDTVTETHQILHNYSPDFPSKIASITEGTFKPSFINQLVSSQLDCDRFDYLLRDSLMTGAQYGKFDLEWIIHALAIDPEEDFIYVHWRGLYAVEEYLKARYYMFRQVYFHHTLRSAENMLISILKRAKVLATNKQLDFIIPDSAIQKLLLGIKLTTQEFLELDDYDLMFCIKRWRYEKDPILRDISQRFIDRKLFKLINLPRLSASKERALMEQLSKLLNSTGFDPEYYLLRDSAEDIPYFGPYTPDTANPKKLIYVETNQLHPTRCEITTVSDVVKSMTPYQINGLCFPDELRPQVINFLKKLSLSRK